MMSRAINPKLDALLVEGPDDQAVINAIVETLLAPLKIGHGVQLVRACSGVSNALGQFDDMLPTLRVDDRLGLVIDRDGYVGQDNWPKVQARLSRLGLNLAAPEPRGAICEGPQGRGKVGVWMWPDNTALGDVEHFMMAALPSTPVWRWAQAATDEAKSHHGAEFDPLHSRKAKLKVRSSWLTQPSGGYGHIVNSGQWDSTKAAGLVDWFQRLFLSP